MALVALTERQALMPHYLKMTEDAYGSPNGRAVHRYLAGGVYSASSTPPLDGFLFDAFVSSGRAVACDAEGTPLAPTAPAAKASKTAKSTPADAASTLETAIEQTGEAAIESAATQPASEDPKA